MKTKKIGILAAFATLLLLTAVLLSTCLEPLDTSGINLPPPPVGMGYLVLNISDSAAKTVLPVKPVNTVYEVIILDGLNNPLDLDVISGSGVNPSFTGAETYELPNDTYAVTVNARTSTTTGTIYASGSGSVTINNANNSVTITMEAVTDGGTGTFAWNFTGLPTTPTLDSAELTFVYLGGNATPQTQSPVDITSDTTGSMALAAGQWRVIATFTSDEQQTVEGTLEDEYFTFTRQEVVHIYRNMTSTWNDTAQEFRKRVHQVTYELGTTGTPTWEATNTPVDPYVVHDTFLTTPNAVPTRTDGFMFNGWYVDSAATATPWGFANMPILRDRSVYVGWYDPAADYDLAITVVPYTDPTDLAPTGNDLTILISDIETAILTPGIPDYRTITLAPSSTTDLTNFTWYADGELLSDGSGITITTSSSESLTINIANPALNSVLITSGGVLEIFVTAQHTSGSTYGAKFTISFN